MNRRRAPLLPWLLCSLPCLVLMACSSPERVPVGDAVPDTSGAHAALMAADRLFAVETAARRLDGWMDFYAKDAVRLSLGGSRADSTVVQGLDAIRRFDAGLFADSAYHLLWEPTDAGVFDDGRHGFTTGISFFVRHEAGAIDTLSTGTYITLWRREADGVWRVVLDTGAQDP